MTQKNNIEFCETFLNVSVYRMSIISCNVNCLSYYALHSKSVWKILLCRMEVAKGFFATIWERALQDRMNFLDVVHPSWILAKDDEVEPPCFAGENSQVTHRLLGLFFFWLHRLCRLSSVRVQSPNLWTASKFPSVFSDNFFFVLHETRECWWDVDMSSV